MPRYTYKCSTCEEEFNAVHSMSDKLEKREDCERECELKKIPSNLTFLKNNVKHESNHKVGDVVKSSIEELKQDLKDEKRSLKNKEFSNE